MFGNVTFTANMGSGTGNLSWSRRIQGMANDGWLDIFAASRHVYPEIERGETGIHFREPKIVYGDLCDRRPEDVSSN